MKIRNLLVLPLLFAAAPAFATGGFSCRTTAPEGVRMIIVTGAGQPGGIALVTLRDGSRIYSNGSTGEPVQIGQSWMDERSLLVELLDPKGERRVARLRAGRGGEPESRNLAGSLEYGGLTYRILCIPEH